MLQAHTLSSKSGQYPLPKKNVKHTFYQANVDLYLKDKKNITCGDLFSTTRFAKINRM